MLQMYYDHTPVSHRKYSNVQICIIIIFNFPQYGNSCPSDSIECKTIHASVNAVFRMEQIDDE